MKNIISSWFDAKFLRGKDVKGPSGMSQLMKYLCEFF